MSTLTRSPEGRPEGASLEGELSGLSFARNFVSFVVRVDFTSTGQVEVVNPYRVLNRGQIPLEWMVVDAVASSGSPGVVRGSIWNPDRLSFVNPPGGTVSVRIRLFV